MKASAAYGKEDIQAVDVDPPEVHDDGILIKMHASGICGTDLHAWNSGLFIDTGTKEVDGERIIGHEFTGEIIEVGDQVEDYEVGDRVASTHNKGGMAEYIEVHGDALEYIFKIPEGLEYDLAATMEPFSNPMHTYRMKEPENDDTVAIFGGGIIGLGYLQIIKAYTEATTILVEVAEKRLKTAREIGSDHVINARNEDVLGRIKEISGENEIRYHSETTGGCDIAVDCAGSPVTPNQMLQSLKPKGGTAIVAALFGGKVEIDPTLINLKEIDVLGSWGYSKRESLEAMDLIASGRVDRERMITQRFSLEDTTEGFRTAADPEKSIKVMFMNDS